MIDEMIPKQGRISVGVAPQHALALARGEVPVSGGRSD